MLKNSIYYAVGHVHLAVDELVAAKNHGRPHPPGEEQLVDAFVVLKQLSGMFLHCKIEREPPHLVIGHIQEFHNVFYK